MGVNNKELYKARECFLCGSKGTQELIDIIREKPERETDFQIKPEDYYREISFCQNCGVYNNHHEYDFSSLYTENYNEATYKNKIKETFNKIMILPEGKSDNKLRVERIISYLNNNNDDLNKAKVLDVGSGLCVFLAELQKHGVEGYCIDPSPESVDHAKDFVKVKDAFCGPVEDYKTDVKFNLISFNKVLEHVVNPIEVLIKTKDLLKEDGAIYIELPEGTTSREAESVFIREEFFIEHYTIFTEKSIEYLAKAAGFTIKEIKEIYEPSTKYTLYAFIK